jgi:hypothetical protein
VLLKRTRRENNNITLKRVLAYTNYRVICGQATHHIQTTSEYLLMRNSVSEIGKTCFKSKCEDCVTFTLKSCETSPMTDIHLPEPVHRELAQEHVDSQCSICDLHGNVDIPTQV